MKHVKGKQGKSEGFDSCGWQGWGEYYSGTRLAQNDKHEYTKNIVLEYYSSTDFPVLVLVCSVLAPALVAGLVTLFGQRDLEIAWMTVKNNNCKCSNQIHILDFLACVTLKFDEWWSKKKCIWENSNWLRRHLSPLNFHHDPRRILHLGES